MRLHREAETFTRHPTLNGTCMRIRPPPSPMGLPSICTCLSDKFSSIATQMAKQAVKLMPLLASSKVLIVSLLSKALPRCSPPSCPRVLYERSKCSIRSFVERQSARAIPPSNRIMFQPRWRVCRPQVLAASRLAIASPPVIMSGCSTLSISTCPILLLPRSSSSNTMFPVSASTNIWHSSSSMSLFWSTRRRRGQEGVFKYRARAAVDFRSRRLFDKFK
mmetsp:Transcript_15262/g.22964  ORF Transcript_15262/g.22964 Transcript_15262/m.22964 type:complete len:220 (-) Transcript_15262:676-1335(-)